MSKARAAFYTLGCKLNFSETSTLARRFGERGFAQVPFHERADVYLINTCSVTENADKKCRKVVRDVRRRAPDAYVVIVGCYAQLKPHEIAGIPGVDAVLGAAEKFQLFDYLPDFERDGTTHVHAGEVAAANTFHAAASVRESGSDSRTRTFLKVQDGCDYSCTFCTIPLARGASRSDGPENVVARARAVAAEGVREIVLTGVNTGDWGIIDGRRQHRFVDLVRALDGVAEIDRFRISSIEPNLLHGEIIDFVAESRRFVPHFHVPLQSGSNDLLGKMRRRYRRELYAERVAHVRRRMPGACIGVDVIVGFPGETDAHFEETYRFLTELEVSYLHVFPYSERTNTPAATYDGVVPKHVRHERVRMLMNLSEKKRRAFYEAQLGQSRPVLWEHDVADGRMQGFTDNYVRVSAPYDPLRVGEIERVALDEIDAAGVVRTAGVHAAG
ncbi:MAG: tRNA (N(6)-L-threonylcarbamoyladenosine(37)-C(2))-methylthiotransferase MtaB [Catalinimonas sp.]